WSVNSTAVADDDFGGAVGGNMATGTGENARTTPGVTFQTNSFVLTAASGEEGDSSSFVGRNSGQSPMAQPAVLVDAGGGMKAEGGGFGGQDSTLSSAVLIPPIAVPCSVPSVVVQNLAQPAAAASNGAAGSGPASPPATGAALSAAPTAGWSPATPAAEHVLAGASWAQCLSTIDATASGSTDRSAAVDTILAEELLSATPSP
ncbi:MAG: hypothetical protein ABSF26_26970, partial [Thermoguttaceae bacterium]